MKLFAFYLLYAVSKNVYELNAHHFSSFVVPLYLESHSQVDENTRNNGGDALNLAHRISGVQEATLALYYIARTATTSTWQ